MTTTTNPTTSSACVLAVPAYHPLVGEVVWARVDGRRRAGTVEFVDGDRCEVLVADGTGGYTVADVSKADVSPVLGRRC